jgi:hypothetical protein
MSGLVSLSYFATSNSLQQFLRVFCLPLDDAAYFVRPGVHS